MSLASKRLASATGLPVLPPSDAINHRLEITVVFTSTKATTTALKKAAALAAGLAARITLVVPQVVPYPLPIERPPVPIDLSEQRLRKIADKVPVETAVHLHLCRDRLQTLTALLRPRSLVVVGGPRRRWWPTEERSLARKLRRAGHEVIFAES